MKRWIVRVYFDLNERHRLNRSMGVEVGKDKGEMRRRLRRLRRGTPRAWNWRYSLEIEPRTSPSNGESERPK